MAIESRKWSARTDDAQVDRNATGFAKVIFRGVHKLAAQAGALPRRIHTEQPEVAAIGAEFDVNATDEASGILGEEEFPFCHVRAKALSVNSITFNESLLDAEGGIYQADEIVHVSGGRHAEMQAFLARDYLSTFIHARTGILTCRLMISSVGGV
jgi:hypothetical protein